MSKSSADKRTGGSIQLEEDMLGDSSSAATRTTLRLAHAASRPLAHVASRPYKPILPRAADRSAAPSAAVFRSATDRE
eukprot:2598063-Prymnesium_polylepis.2